MLDDGQVREVVGELAAAAPETVIAIHPRSPTPQPRNWLSPLAPHGIHVIDAPVSGGVGAARNGELATMVGAPREVYERIKPVFRRGRRW